MEVGSAKSEVRRPCYPPATADGMAILAELLADRGVELRIDSAGGLRFRDREKRLMAADRLMVRHYSAPLAAWVAGTNPDTNKHLTESEAPAALPSDASRCTRCNSTEFNDVPIHAGQSTRRDCARCGRTWGFPRWYGKEGRRP